MFAGLSDKKGAHNACAPGLTVDKLQAIAVEVRDEVIDMFIACETQYTEAVNIFARIVAANAKLSAEIRHAANAKVERPREAKARQLPLELRA